MLLHAKISEINEPANFSLTTHFPVHILQGRTLSIPDSLFQYLRHTSVGVSNGTSSKHIWNLEKGRTMIKNKLKPSVCFVFLISILFFPGLLYSGQPVSAPVIHMDQTTHTFPTVFEGERLSHDFMVSNQGSADLEIEDVTHQ
jgi:hypothetical protein